LRKPRSERHSKARPEKRTGQNQPSDRGPASRPRRPSPGGGADLRGGQAERGGPRTTGIVGRSGRPRRGGRV